MKIGLIAGSGNFPLYIARENPNAFVMCIEGFSDTKCFKNFSKTVSLLNPDTWIKTLNENEVTHIVFAGKIKRPNNLGMTQDNKSYGMISKILSVGDNQALIVIENFFKKNGFKILPIYSIFKNCFFSKGYYGDNFSNFNFKQYVKKSSEFGIDLLNAISKYDVGQSLIVSDNLVYAIEGLEGTNSMINRAKDLISNNKNLNNFGPVLIKIPKTGQSKNMDLPVIGLETVKKCINAGLSSLVISSKGTLVIDYKEIKLLISKSQFCVLSV
jgi:DUF1009 family protein